MHLLFFQYAGFPSFDKKALFNQADDSAAGICLFMDWSLESGVCSLISGALRLCGCAAVRLYRSAAPSLRALEL